MAAPFSSAGHGEDRLDVGAEGGLQRLRRHQRVVRLLEAVERGRGRRAAPGRRRAATSMALTIRLSIGSVTLCDWSSMCAGWKPGAALLGVDQLVEDEEQPVGVDRAGVEVVVAVLRIVEVEAAELAELDQPRDDHLDVDVRRMVAEVDEAEGLRPELRARSGSWCPSPAPPSSRRPARTSCARRRAASRPGSAA